MAKAVSTLPKSVKIWMAASKYFLNLILRYEKNDADRSKVL